MTHRLGRLRELDVLATMLGDLRHKGHATVLSTDSSSWNAVNCTRGICSNAQRSNLSQAGFVSQRRTRRASAKGRSSDAARLSPPIEAILLEPDGDRLEITLKGDVAGMLSAAGDSKRSTDTGDLLVQIKLVAGARNQRYLQLWRGVA